jgi:uncharacterized protein
MPDFSLLDWAVALLIAQAILGALDTLYHHELTVALPYRRCWGVAQAFGGTASSRYGVAGV